MATALGAFLLSGLTVVVAGAALARYGDAIGEHTGLGGLWVGALLLAAATSLPELATDVAAVRLGAPDLAAGDLFGSSMANMLLLAFVDLAPPRRGVLRRATLESALTGCLAIALNALAALFVLARPTRTVLGVGPESAFLVAVYLLGLRAIYRQAARDRGASPAAEPPAARALPTLRRSIAGFAVAAAVILLAAPVFAASAKTVAERSGLGTTFVGTWLVGFATSLPELASTLAAVRLGAYDLAVGNLFGSNGFNMAIFFALDLAYPGGPFLGAISPVHAVTGLVAVVLTSLGLAALVYRAQRRFAMLEPDAFAIVVGYVLGLLLVHRLSAGG